ncbi:MAG TPA: ABC transporter ATP-binding protein [Firmicutes bacterium]|nr:ABC transporter ATP-binding protein [Bacillota bacterium]
MLEVNDLHVYYGGIHALSGVSFKVEEGEIVTLIGANGAGKSTCLKAISGLIQPRSGCIRLKGQALMGIPAHKIAEAGVIHVPEGRRVFANMTVLENLEMGAFARSDRSGIEKDLREVFRRFPRLEERKYQLAGTLSGGEQQMLAIGRGLMARPKIMLLDEPSMGLSPILVREIFDIIKSINAAGTTVLLVEQNAYMALQTAKRAYVLETGFLTMEGPCDKLLADPKVRSAYLGE